MYDMPKQKDQSANVECESTKNKSNGMKRNKTNGKMLNRPDGMRANSNKNKRTLLLEYNISFLWVSVFSHHNGILAYTCACLTSHIRIEFSAKIVSFYLVVDASLPSVSVDEVCRDPHSTCF